MAENPVQPPKKIHKVWLIEILIGTCYLLWIDVAQIVLNLIVGIGVPINRIIDIIIVCLILLWAFLTNRMNSRIIKLILAAFIIEMIPLVDVLPMWTLEFWYIVYLINTGKVKTYSKKELLRGDGAKKLAAETATDIAKKPIPLPPGADKIPGMDKLEGVVGKRVAGIAENTVKNAVRNRISDTQNGDTSTPPTSSTNTPFGNDSQNTNQTSSEPVARHTIQNNDRGKGKGGVDRTGLAKVNLPWNELYAEIKAENPNQSDAWIRRRVEIVLAAQREEEREEEKREARMRIGQSDQQRSKKAA